MVSNQNWPQLRLSLVIPSPVAALVMRLKSEFHFIAPHLRDPPAWAVFSSIFLWGALFARILNTFLNKCRAGSVFTSVFCYGFSGSSSHGCDSVVSTRRRRCRCVLCDLCTSGLVAALGTACCMYECVCVSSIPNWPLATLPLLWPPVFNCTLRSNRICALFSAVNPKYTAHSECISVYICVSVCVCVL